MSSRPFIFSLLFFLTACARPASNTKGPSTQPAAASPKSAATMLPPPVTFMTVPDHALRIVYICERDGTFLGSFDIVRWQLRKSLEGLTPRQSFALIFPGDKDNPSPDTASYLASHEQLAYACSQTLDEAFTFLDRRAGPSYIENPAHPLERKGQAFATNTLPAIRKAFSLQPDVIYLMTNGDFPSNDEVLSEIRRLNKGKQVRINTIAYSAAGEEYQTLLKKIAAENSGTFRFVTDDDLPR